MLLLFIIVFFNGKYSFHKSFRSFVPITILVCLMALLQFAAYRSIWSLRYFVSLTSLLCVVSIAYKDNSIITSYIKNNLKWITAIYFTVFGLQLYARVTGNSLLEEVVPRLFGVVSSRTTESRGLTLLSPEPSYSGFFALLIWSYITAKCYTMKLLRIDIRYFWLVFAVSSLSASVIFTILPLFVIFKVIRVRPLVIVIFLLLVLILKDSSFRFVNLISELISNPEILVSDLSSASRIAALIVGPLSILDCSNFIGLWNRDFFDYANYLFERYFDLSIFLKEGFSTSIKIKSV